MVLIVGGVLTFLAAAIKVARLFSDDSAAPAPVGDGSAPASETLPASVASAAGAPAGPPSDHSPGAAVLAPAGDRSAQAATETFPEPTESAAAAPAAPTSDLPRPSAYRNFVAVFRGISNVAGILRFFV